VVAAAPASAGKRARAPPAAAATQRREEAAAGWAGPSKAPPVAAPQVAPGPATRPALLEPQAVDPHQAAAQGIARTFQNIALFKGMSVLDNVMTGRNLKMTASFVEQAIWVGRARREELENRRKVEEVIDFLEIQHIRKTPVGRLPYGLQKRVELARALAAEPSMLLLDEPMAGMNVEEKQDMCRFVLDVNEQFGTTIVLIEHDMGVVMDISDRVVVLTMARRLATGRRTRSAPARPSSTHISASRTRPSCHSFSKS
jgi:ABC-type branched-subunit amino acid transport system ATPase component